MNYILNIYQHSQKNKLLANISNLSSAYKIHFVENFILDAQDGKNLFPSKFAKDH